MKETLKSISLLKYFVVSIRALKRKNPLSKTTKQLFSYFKDYYLYKKLPKNSDIQVKTRDLFPRITDKTSTTDIDPVYFIQGCWCAKKVFEAKPSKHYDIASQALMVGIISQFTPTTMIDIRPLSVSIPGLSFIKGDILHLPFKDEEVQSLSSICVIEHIGLGRYGDTLDQFGTEKAAKEISRVLAKNGRLYISVPIDSENRTYFNAHRAFTRQYILNLFKDLKLVEEKYIYGKNLTSTYDASLGFGTGLYAFTK
jgi:SAM-dependent methyltransferase